MPYRDIVPESYVVFNNHVLTFIDWVHIIYFLYKILLLLQSHKLDHSLSILDTLVMKAPLWPLALLSKSRLFYILNLQRLVGHEVALGNKSLNQYLFLYDKLVIHHAVLLSMYIDGRHDSFLLFQPVF